jgi:hypothetical protein
MMIGGGASYALFGRPAPHKMQLSTSAADAPRLETARMFAQPIAPPEPDLIAAKLAPTSSAVRTDAPAYRAIFHIWPDFPVSPCITKSVATIKADAAQNVWVVTCRGDWLCSMPVASERELCPVRHGGVYPAILPGTESLGWNPFVT